jgi:hypothetical protein
MKKMMLPGIIGMILPMISYAEPVIEREVEQQKVYIEPAQLLFADREMFAFVAGEWVSVDTIQSDANGIFIKPCIDYSFVRWICPACGYNNDGEARTCQRDLRTGGKCGYPRPNPK